ncbi:hypothetical protein F4809DRAFT_619474 [Biscogniauxia mediterranea]|nr:hypothetical protein F4809DRAFT_619474 [Biscogniauxia mediterranea]
MCVWHMKACRRCLGHSCLLLLTYLPTCLHPGLPRIKLTIGKGEPIFYVYVCNVGLCIGRIPPFFLFQREGENGNGSGFLSSFFFFGVGIILKYLNLHTLTVLTNSYNLYIYQ